ncbi:MAG TPA: hypothetical protein VGC41_29885, partial [Kofleriaceae bacterium]
MRVVLASLVLAGCFAHHDPSSTPDAGDQNIIQPDATCGGVHLDLAYVPPNLGIVLDRSCSMKKALDG